MQEQIITKVCEGQDCVVLMPTGGGKSVCYQIPAIIQSGTGVVISPLISLMKDQVEGLRANGVEAAYLNSTLGSSEQRAVEEDFLQGKLDLLYVSPEKVTAQSFLPVLQKATINLIAIDEAHCISSWGHDFRPEYTRLKFLKSQFPNIPVIGLTATADKLTRDDIISQMGMFRPEVFVASFDRPNLSLTVKPGHQRMQQILQFLQDHSEDAGIIYCLSRKSTEKIAEKLRNAGYSAEAYHAGLGPEERSAVQERFINDETPIVCATIAFGMGIDKSNVRFVIHYNLPKNIEGYYQEIGRAGRDGLASDTLLFYSFGDVMLLRDIITQNGSKNEEVQLAKLDRMKEYAESLICRRKMLLNYFGESLENNCGNCDVCENPPRYVDGTVIAQKALSAVYRLRERAAAGLLIDVLRGSGKQEIIRKGYDKLKTYGAGRDIPALDWQHYINQFISLGLLEVAYNRHNALTLRPAAHEVLFEGRKVDLVQPSVQRGQQQKQRSERSSKVDKREELFQRLRQIRKKVAKDFGVPPYQIFNDATLKAMSEQRPMSDDEMRRIPGVGDRKLQRYGDFFIDAIIEFSSDKKASLKGSTYEVTYALLKKGATAEEIAVKRGLNVSTVLSHIAYLYEKGEAVDISPYVSLQSAQTIVACLKYLEKPVRLKDIFEYHDGKFQYDQIRFALAYHKRQQHTSP